MCGRAGLVIVGFFFADPALDADLAINGQRLGETVVDILTEGVQRHAALALPLTASDVRATETAGALNTDTLGAKRHGHFNGLFHSAAESDAAFELERNILSHERGLDLGLLHFLDIEEDFLAGQLGKFLFDLLDLLALASDDDAGTGGVNLD